MNIEQFLHNESLRKDVYKSLSRCFYLPGENIATHVADLVEALQHVEPELAEMLVGLDEDVDLEQLIIEFSRLFVGPFKLLAPPYGSVYLESGRQVMGDSTMDAKKRYQEAGLGISNNLKEAPDHIAIELEFIYYLIFREIEAFAELDEASVLTLWTTQKSFLSDHIGAWVTPFYEAVEEQSKLDFYKKLVHVTKLFVLKDKEKISRAFFPEPVVA
jgi:TorA maturation chaperone TorD